MQHHINFNDFNESSALSFSTVTRHLEVSQLQGFVPLLYTTGYLKMYMYYIYYGFHW